MFIFLKKFINPGARGRFWWIFVFIVIISLAAALVDFNPSYNRGVDWLAVKTGQKIKLPKIEETPFRLGLDLLGGTHLVYKAEVGNIPAADRMDALNGVRDVIERRVNVFGVSEPVVQVNKSGDEYQVIVELAGVKSVSEAIKMIGETPLLEFKEQAEEKRELTVEEKKQMEDYNRQAKTKAEEIVSKLAGDSDFSSLAKEYSEDEESKANGGDLGWVTEKDQAELVALGKNLKVGEYTKELALGASGYEILKLEGRRVKTNAFNSNEEEKEVQASHILICHKESQMCANDLTKEEALKKINDLKARATPYNFASLAKANSSEPGAETSGGDLGWFGRGAMVKPFEDAVFAQAVGTVSGVVETDFGYHLIHKIAERKIEEYNFRRILVRTISAADILGGADWKITELTGKNLKRATVEFSPNDGSPEVALEFDNEGAKMFEDITSRNVGKPVAIFLDNYPISVPNVNEKITGGRAVITGNFNIKEAKLLAQRLNAGALPVPITLINQQTVGASLGKQSVNDSLRAGLIGFLLIAVFMIVYYRLPGVLAVLALSVYAVLVLALFKLWPVTLTLAGVAGFILSIGMAVDANVIIFERLKEELKLGKPVALAIEDGFKRSWPAIRDGNFSTLITCFILIQFSTSIVKGFAITLSLGILMSMFSAIIVTKNFLNLVGGRWLENKKWLFGLRNK